MRRRDLAQRNVTASTQRTQAAIADARTAANDRTLSGRAREIAQAELAAHRNYLLECRDAQATLDDGELPEGWC